jgi:hypothetical protein
MTKLNERIANVPERIFILAQLALGLLLAAGGGYCILRFGNDGEHFNSLGLAAALVLCGGQVSGIVDGRTTTKEEVGLLMTRFVKEAKEA